jgi:sugar lactone lactonase YvrE
MIELAAGYGALEGPVLDSTGDLYFSEIPTGVHALRADGSTEVVLRERPNVGGLAFHASGALVVSGPDVMVLDLERRTERILLTLADLTSKPGATSPGFNDLVPDDRGRLWVGVLRRDAAGEHSPGEILCVTGEHAATVVHDDIYPNGIAVSPDGRTMYCADTFRKRIVALEVTDDETLAKEVGAFATDAQDGYPDGVATDVDGGVWVASWQGRTLARYTPTGALDRVIELDAMPLSMCFGGSDLLVVTGPSEQLPGSTGSVLRLGVGVLGSPVALVGV